MLASLVAAAVLADPVSFSIHLRAEVPVACSTAGVVSSDVVGGDASLVITGACNTRHQVRVRYEDPGLTARPSFVLNGEAPDAAAEAVFDRQAYFGSTSILRMSLLPDDAFQTAAVAQTIRIEVSPY
jgi:hypothetical protein